MEVFLILLIICSAVYYRLTKKSNSNNNTNKKTTFNSYADFLKHTMITDDIVWRATVTWMEEKLKDITERALPAMQAQGRTATAALIQVCEVGYESFKKDFHEFNKTLPDAKIDHDDLTYYLKGVQLFIGLHYEPFDLDKIKTGEVYVHHDEVVNRLAETLQTCSKCGEYLPQYVSGDLITVCKCIH